MNFIDFFAGIGGFRRGLEKAGHKCVGWCEWDKYARQSYEAIHNTEGEWTASDIRTVRAADLPRADLWTYGFPCQSLSVAGKMEGFFKGEDKEEGQTTGIEQGEQTRSGLFFEIIRLLRELPKENRPKWLLAENVKNLLSIEGGWGFARCIVALGEMGYNTEWQVFNTKYDYNVAGVCISGIAQNRERIYLLSRLTGEGCSRKVFPISRADKENPAELSQIGKLKTQANCDEQGVSTTERDNPQRMRVYGKDGLTPALNCMQGGGREPLVTEELKVRQIGHIEGYQLENPQAYRVYDESGASPTLTSAADGKVPWVVDSNDVKQIGHGISQDGKPIQGYGVYDKDGMSPTLTTGWGSAQPYIIDDLYLGRDARVYTDSAPTLRTNAGGLKVAEDSKINVIGNYSPSGYNATRVVAPDGIAPTVMENHGQVTAVTVQAVLTPDRLEKRQNGRRMKEDGEPMFTLTTQDIHGVAIGDALTEMENE